jgi:hypothetical protein
VAERPTIAAAGIASGLIGGLVLGLPIVLYDWANGSHSALELPMAVTAWLFGLDRFDANGYDAWSIVIGALFLVLWWAISGLAYAALAERVYDVKSWAGSLSLGAAWSFVSFMLIWYMLLPIARDGEPFRELPGSAAFVAPNWIWILAYSAFGVATAVSFRLLRGSGRATR